MMARSSRYSCNSSGNTKHDVLLFHPPAAHRGGLRLIDIVGDGNSQDCLGCFLSKNINTFVFYKRRNHPKVCDSTKGLQGLHARFSFSIEISMFILSRFGEILTYSLKG